MCFKVNFRHQYVSWPKGICSLFKAGSILKNPSHKQVKEETLWSYEKCWKTIWQIQQLFMIKTPSKLGIQRNFLNLIKNIYKKTYIYTPTHFVPMQISLWSKSDNLPKPLLYMLLSLFDCHSLASACLIIL